MKLRTPEAVEVTLEDIEHLTRDELAEHLEHGRLVYFPEAPIGLPPAEDIDFLRTETPRYHRRKNVSWYPSGRLSGLGGPRAMRERAGRILREHHERVEAFLEKVIPSFVPDWDSATSSLRAFQEANREIPLRQRSDLLHLDAGTYGATHGNLILRFLTNLDQRERVWRVRGTAEDIIHEVGAAAGLEPGRILEDGPGGRVLSELLRGLSAIVPAARSLERSAYDRSMRRVHNFMKEDDDFQKDPEGATEIRFGPRSCWLVFADMVGHACAQGRLCLINTFIVPRKNFRHPELSPYEILRRLEEGAALTPARELAQAR